MTKTASYPKFSPVRTYKHEIMGNVDVYDISAIPAKERNSNGSGAQTDFFHNNAEINNPKQFGIKLFGTSVEAYAAWQRQKKAAAARLAPPVGRMIQWKLGKWSRWGYQTCIAEVDISLTEMTILCCPAARRKYMSWARWKGVNPTNIRKNSSAFAKDSEWSIRYVCDTNGRWISGPDQQPMLRPQHELECDQRLVSESDGNRVPRWDISSYDIGVIGDSTLCKKLSEIDLSGTQYDYLWDIADDGGNSFAGNSRLRLGKNWWKKEKACLGGDLHFANIGLWNGRPVCIDFGFHSVKNIYNKFDI